jgi:hypothetical protein
MKRPTLGTITNIALIAAAVFVVSDRFRPAGTPPTPTLENWADEIETGIATGHEDAPIKIVELMDFQ